MLDAEVSLGGNHIKQRERLVNRHEVLLQKIYEKNAHKEKYWILGKPDIQKKNGRTTITPFLKAYDEKPEMEKESYLYEVNNLEGTKELLWVMHPNDHLRIPSLGKSIRVANVNS